MKSKVGMLSAEKIISNIVDRIARVYERPLMFGGSAAGVEVLLLSLHETLAMCEDREDEFWQAFHSLHESEGHQAMNCSTFHSQQEPLASEAAIAAHVIEFFKRLNEELGLGGMTTKPGQPEPGVGADSR